MTKRGALCLAVLLLGGCYAYRPAGDRGIAERVPAGAWDEPVSDDLRALEAETPPLVFRYAVDGSIPFEERDPKTVELAGRVEKRVTHVALRDGGLLRLYEEPWSRPDDPFEVLDGVLYGFEPNGSFLTSLRLERERASKLERPRDAPDVSMKMLRTMYPGLRRAEPSRRRLLLGDEGILVGVPPVSPDARGIILHLPALFRNTYETRVLEHLQTRGWALAHVETETHLAGPHEPERARARAARRRRGMELMTAGDMERFSQLSSRARMERYEAARAQVRDEIPMPETGFEVRAGDDPEAKAAVIAEAVDRHLREHANASAALIGYLDDHRPDLSGKPVVVMGFSAGALIAPTVAARLEERVSALVLVSGAASLYDVARASTLGDGGLELAPEDGPAPPDDLLDAIGALYRQRSALDPYVIAPALRDLPVLHLYGRRDDIVPASASETLQTRLGDPERLVYGGGHYGLFFFLPGERKRIARWIDEVLDAG